MARRWISYSIDQDPRRRRRRIWQWRWSWNRGRGPRYGRPHVVQIQPARQRVLFNDGERRRIWPWLLLLLLIPLFLGILALLLLDGPERSGRAERTNTGSPPGAVADQVPGGGVPPVDSALALTHSDAGSALRVIASRTGGALTKME